MRPLRLLALTTCAAATVLAGCASSSSGGGAGNPMTFFVTSSNPGQGGNLGGLAGADAYCQKLASTVGAGGQTWRAYLSTQGAQAVNARDRIGKGPWLNAKGEAIATSVDNLHSAGNNLNKKTALTEKGEIVAGRGDAVNMHDILTGSTAEGRSVPSSADATCGNWTSATTGSAIVGHHDRIGLNESAPMKSWNHSHPSKACDMPALKSTGGDGRFYCFAVD